MEKTPVVGFLMSHVSMPINHLLKEKQPLGRREKVIDLAKGKLKSGQRAAKGKLKKSLLTIQQKALQYRLMSLMGRQQSFITTQASLLTRQPIGTKTYSTSMVKP